ncbi:MAG: STAS domain-containing protein [Verrucomicrobia bacterium]|nr:STAS domain-containing protein [Verrucomicrobiota bacterium]
MKLSSSKSGPATVIKVEDRMDAQSCLDFEKACYHLIDEGEKLLVVDLGSLVYVSSAGLRSFLGVAKRLRETGGALRLCCLGGIVKQVFDTAGLTPVFPIFDSVAAALN